MADPTIPQECLANLSSLVYFTPCVRALCRQKDKELTDSGIKTVRDRFSQEFQKNPRNSWRINWLGLANELANMSGICGPPLKGSRTLQEKGAKSPVFDCSPSKTLMKSLSEEESLGISILVGAAILTMQALKYGARRVPLFGLILSAPLMVLEEEAFASTKNETKDEWVPPKRRDILDWLKYIWDYTFGIPNLY